MSKMEKCLKKIWSLHLAQSFRNLLMLLWVRSSTYQHPQQAQTQPEDQARALQETTAQLSCIQRNSIHILHQQQAEVQLYVDTAGSLLVKSCTQRDQLRALHQGGDSWIRPCPSFQRASKHLPSNLWVATLTEKTPMVMYIGSPDIQETAHLIRVGPLTDPPRTLLQTPAKEAKAARRRKLLLETVQIPWQTRKVMRQLPAKLLHLQVRMPAPPTLFLFHLGASRSSWNLKRSPQGQKTGQFPDLALEHCLVHMGSAMSNPTDHMISTHDPAAGITLYQVELMGTAVKLLLNSETGIILHQSDIAGQMLTLTDAQLVLTSPNIIGTSAV